MAPGGGGVKELAGGLTAWALDVLLPGDLDSGLYSAEFVTLVDDDEPDQYLYTVSICQNGPDQVSTWPDPHKLLSA
nr:hypothetical protein [Kibdelosporangium sp. MJ126-NF4]